MPARKSDPATGARATPIYQTASFVFPGQRSRGGAVQHGARRPRLFAHLQSDGRGARGTRRGARRRRRRDRHRQRTGGAAPGDRHAARRGLAYRRVALAVRRLAQPARLHAAALRHRDDVRRSARHRRVARGGAPGDAPLLRRDAGQSGTRRARHSARGGTRARARACRCWSIRRSPRPGSCGRSTTAPTSSSIRRRNSCPATAWSSAACWSIPGASTGTAAPRAANSRR